MSDPFVGEIRMFAGTFAPRNYAFCDGQLLTIAQNNALFSLLGTTYGGDGLTTFALPDLRGRIPLHQGSGPGLSSRTIGRSGGTETATVTTDHLPSHRHGFLASTSPASESRPAGKTLAADAPIDMYSTYGATHPMAPVSTADAGGGGSHPNLQPFLCIHFILALYGVYPSRT